MEFLEFLFKARQLAYASIDKKYKVKSRRKGHKEYRVEMGNWVYVDCYAGKLRAWGRETVWFKGKPYWIMSYGGGMKNLQEDYRVVESVSTFLKKALSVLANEDFQPRGQRLFKDESGMEYICNWEGDVSNFRGQELIVCKGNELFIHDFTGGLIE